MKAIAWLVPLTAVVAVLLILAVACAAPAHQTSSNTSPSNFRDVPVNQTIQRGDVSVTLESLRLGEHETQLTYRYDSPQPVEPVGLPVVTLPGGGQIETDSGGGFDGEMPITRTFTLPTLPDATSVTVDVGSFIQSVPLDPAVSVEIPLGDELNDEVPLGAGFSVGEAHYIITRLLLNPNGFDLIVEPANDAASRKVVGGPTSDFNMTDNHGRQYESFAAGAEWNPARGGGHVMSYQGLHFSGSPIPGATLTLRVGGMGVIQAPFAFEVEIPEEPGDT